MWHVATNVFFFFSFFGYTFFTFFFFFFLTCREIRWLAEKKERTTTTTTTRKNVSIGFLQLPVLLSSPAFCVLFTSRLPVFLFHLRCIYIYIHLYLLCSTPRLRMDCCLFFTSKAAFFFVGNYFLFAPRRFPLVGRVFLSSPFFKRRSSSLIFRLRLLLVTKKKKERKEEGEKNHHGCFSLGCDWGDNSTSRDGKERWAVFSPFFCLFVVSSFDCIKAPFLSQLLRTTTLSRANYFSICLLFAILNILFLLLL